MDINRRDFIKKASILTVGSPLINLSSPQIKFSVIGINHGHIYGMVRSLLNAGGQLKNFYALEDDLASVFSKQFPDAIRVSTPDKIYEDPEIQLICSSAIPVERAPIGIKAMQHGKDYMVDKPGITTLSQLEEVKKVQRKTNRIYSISYSERFENRATMEASKIVTAGTIGKVVQTIGLGPHSMHPHNRPYWFFDKKYFGGIITDIGSHQFDQFLHFTGSTSAEIMAAQVKNVTNSKYPNFEDFGDVMVNGNQGSGYIRVDWFSPDGLKSWGDGRLTILGTEGYIEIRKNIDIGGKSGGSHLFLVTKTDTKYIDTKNTKLSYGKNLINDIINRTETAMTQDHCFLATELALNAQNIATNKQ